MTRTSILGVPVDRVDAEEAVGKVRELISDRRFRLLVTIDALGMLKARKDPQYLAAIEESAMVLADGAGVVWAVEVLTGMRINRVSGVDFMLLLCRAAAEKRWKIFLLGAGKEVAEELAGKLESQFPGIQIVGAENGFFKNEEEVLGRIKNAGPDILFLAMGAPKQEKWAWQNREKIGQVLVMGVGGAFDVLSGRKKRAPLWMQRAGLEWLFRLIQEPCRIKRMIKLPAFVIKVLMEKYT